jgi:hypothetical protein
LSPQSLRKPDGIGTCRNTHLFSPEKFLSIAEYAEAGAETGITLLKSQGFMGFRFGIGVGRTVTQDCIEQRINHGAPSSRAGAIS